MSDALSCKVRRLLVLGVLLAAGLAARAGQAQGTGDGSLPFAQSVRVGEGGVIEGAAIAALVKQAVAARLIGEDHELALSGQVSDAQVRPGPATLEISLPPSGELAGPLVVPIAVRQGGRLTRRLGVPVEVHRFAELVVLSSPLARGEVVRPEMVRIERSEWPLHHEPYRTLEEVIGCRARRQLAAGQTLTARDVEPLPLIERGAVVRVLFERGALEVEVRGEALADGWEGDRVRVKSDDLGRTIEGIVVGPGQIRFEL